MNTKKISIIGGGGFIGSALADRLSKSFKVKNLDLKAPQGLKGRVKFQYCDIRNYNEVKRALRDADLVILAAIIQIPIINEAKKLSYEVNILGTQNVCEVVNKSLSVKGLILTGSWHVFGERELTGIINEEFGFRPDKVEERARLYALSKIAQEVIVRYYDEMSDKIYGIIRMGTVLGENMHEKTAANIFISKGLKGEIITPFKHSMYRPMLYVDINDLCKAFEVYVKKILNNEINKEGGSLARIVNLAWPEPVTILELATMVRDAIVRYSGGSLKPEIKIIDTGQPNLYRDEDKTLITVDMTKTKEFLGIQELTTPKQAIERIIERRISLS